MRLTIFSPPSMVSARRSIAILSACYPPLGSRPREAGRSAATSSDGSHLPFRWRRSIPLAIPAATFAVATRELRSTSTTAVERAAPSGERWQASAQSGAIICEVIPRNRSAGRWDRRGGNARSAPTRPRPGVTGRSASSRSRTDDDSTRLRAQPAATALEGSSLQ